MNSHSDIKKAVLKGVYEDNVGIPRARHGRRQNAPVATSQECVPRSGRRGKALLITLLGVVILFGINFRLVMVDWTGPVAMQVVEKPMLQSPAFVLPVLDSASVNLILDGDRPDSDGQTWTLNDEPRKSGHQDEIFSRLGMPMADLFNLKVQTIVIDPGHGGIDPGATGHQGLKEKAVTLDIARRLRDKLSVSGQYRVLLTREDDRKVSLKERIAFAKDNHADLFISTHINSLPTGGEALNFVETYYFGPHTDQKSLALAEKENRDSDYAIVDFREVIARIGDTLKTEESKKLANSIHQHLYKNLKRRNRDLEDAGSKTGPFMVLLGVEVPSVLVEVSCLSNKAEETRLSKPAYRDSVAEFLKVGIVDYLERRTQPITIVENNISK